MAPGGACQNETRADNWNARGPPTPSTPGVEVGKPTDEEFASPTIPDTPNPACPLFEMKFGELKRLKTSPCKRRRKRSPSGNVLVSRRSVERKARLFGVSCRVIKGMPWLTRKALISFSNTLCE